MGIIFDLDNTLINSDIAANFRNNGNWRKVYNLIPEFIIDNNIIKILQYLKKENIETTIVTSSPRNYCEKIVKYFNIPIEQMICYHDTLKHKPDPEPVFKALDCMNKSKLIFSLGDDIKDIIASNSANIISVGCLWWSTETEEKFKQNNANYICKTSLDAYNLIKSNILKL